MAGASKSLSQGAAYTVESTIKCTECNAPLKQTLINKNPNATMDYCCFKISKGILFSNHYTYKEGVRIIGEKNRDFVKEQKNNRNKYGWNEKKHS